MRTEIITAAFAVWLLSSPIALFAGAALLNNPHECDNGPVCRKNAIMAYSGAAVFWVIVLFVALYIVSV